MTAQELYEIVKDVDRSIWPGEVDFDDLRTNSSWWESGRVDGVSDALAEAAFVGAMVRYLIRRDGELYVNKAGTRFRVESSPGEVQSFDTEVEALAAACKQKQEDDDGN